MGILTLPESGADYFDASAMIYSVEKIEPYCGILQPVWDSAGAGALGIIGSHLLLLECLVKPIRAGDSLLESGYRELLLDSNEVELLPFDLAVIERAARIRAGSRLKTPDAIHAATALAANTALFVTNDHDFRRVAGLPVAVLSEVAV